VSKQLSLRDAIAPLLIGVGVAVSVIACSPTHTTPVHVSASQSAQAKGDAQALAKCLPTGATQQIELAHSLTTQSGRDALVAKCGVPPQHRAAFEAAVLSAGENGHLTTHNGRAAFFAVTLPHIIEVNQG
jgi:hypothetical protein